MIVLLRFHIRVEVQIFVSLIHIDSVELGCFILAPQAWSCGHQNILTTGGVRSQGWLEMVRAWTSYAFGLVLT